ncbi:MAG: hypothetical protein M4D80_06015 [Myxococcota bacterium]|nr:hypothetical protein [Deltaproteobacteria bacterium]MDQ3334695.1 hypothetical protein [Myxococcota bacterium]
MRAWLLLVVVACGSEKKPPKPEVQGSLSLDGKPLTVSSCRAGRGVTTYVEVLTAQGKLRFEDKQLFWATTAADGRGDKLDCQKLDRSWGGGMRPDGTAYFRGHLIFACRGPAGAVTGDLMIDCGRITAEERASLDKNRTDMLVERCDDIDKRAAELGATSRCREDKWSGEIQACVNAATTKEAWDACLTAR